MRNAQINTVLEQTISRQRLDKYMSECDGDLHCALDLHERNIRLSEAFYTPLQCIEICLRNKINDELSNSYGADWFQNGNPRLEPDALTMISKAVSQLTQDGREISAGAVVAELSFGFWVGLLGPRYDASLWRAGLYRAFSDNGKPLRRKEVHGRLNALRRLRNRIAHHEPIFFRPLEIAHEEIIGAINWMSPETGAWAKHHSRFAGVFGGP